MKIKFLKKIEILSITFDIKWDKSHSGGSFSCHEGWINIGIEDYKRDPLYVFNILNHEVMEIILTMMGLRYNDNRIENDYLFNFRHKEFEVAIELYTQTISKFL